MRIVYCGSGEFGLDCLDAILRSSCELLHVFTQPQRPAGRGQKPRLCAVGTWAEQNKINCTGVENINEPGVIEQIRSLRPDLLVVIAFNQKIGAELIQLPPKGAINVHGSLLPKYRGAAPINWAIINGETETGVTIITLADKMDSGKILAQGKIPIGSDDSSDIVHDRLARIAAPLLIETIDKIEAGTASYEPQDHCKATKAPKFKKSDGFVDFNDPAEAIRNKIRGMWPWPGAQACYASGKGRRPERLTIVAAEVAATNESISAIAGEFDEQLNVICGKDSLKIIKLKPAGGRVMDFKAFVNGRAVKCGDSFLSIEEIRKQDGQN